jgi:hypothetical protein
MCACLCRFHLSLSLTLTLTLTHTHAHAHAHAHAPVELCFSFSFFFFLHFQGLKMRPRLASLLLRRMGGVWTPDTRQPVCSTLWWSITSTATREVCSRQGGWILVSSQLCKSCHVSMFTLFIMQMKPTFGHKATGPHNSCTDVHIVLRMCCVHIQLQRNRVHT